MEHELEVDCHEAHRLAGRGTPLVDVREARELAQGWATGAERRDGETLEAWLGATLTRRDAPVMLICQTGARSLAWTRRLREAGFTGVLNVRGGMRGWLEAGLPVERPEGVSAAAAERYARHLVLPGVGPAGQAALGRARVIVIGAGGLGNPAALYLAAAGVGTIALLDDDRVERSNLQRQVLFRDDDVGRLKVEAARERLEALNPDIRIEAMPRRLDAANARGLLEGWDVVIDGSDNFPTRFAVNDACVALGIPLAYGAVEGFAGQVSVFAPHRAPGEAPCYRCLFPEESAGADAPACSVAGVLGVLPGLVGTLQATEAIKCLIGQGDALVGRLLRFDALAMRFRESRLRADPGCRVCAPKR